MSVCCCAGIEPLLLDTQYRMHPLIAHIPSKLFYGGRLKSGQPVCKRSELFWSFLDTFCPKAAFITDHTKAESRDIVFGVATLDAAVVKRLENFFWLLSVACFLMWHVSSIAPVVSSPPLK